MHRRVGLGVAGVFALCACIADVASCGGPAKEAGAGDACFRASECQAGLVCVENKCTNDLTSINIHPEGGAGAGGAAAAGAGSGGGGAGGAAVTGAGGSGAGGSGASGAGGSGGAAGAGGPAGSSGSSGSTGTAGSSGDVDASTD